MVFLKHISSFSLELFSIFCGSQKQRFLVNGLDGLFIEAPIIANPLQENSSLFLLSSKGEHSILLPSPDRTTTQPRKALIDIIEQLINP